MKSRQCSIGFCARVLVDTDEGSRITLKLFEDVLQKVIGDDLFQLNESEVEQNYFCLTMFMLSMILQVELCLNLQSTNRKWNCMCFIFSQPFMYLVYLTTFMLGLR